MPIKTGPDYSKLKSSLVSSQTQVTNNALFQTIDQLITGVKTFQAAISNTIDKEFANIIEQLKIITDDITQLQLDITNLSNSYDQGNDDCLDTDISGTPVIFNQTFASVEAIIAIPVDTAPLIVTIDFDFTSVNPTEFSAYVWDNSGARVSATISWLARGTLLV